MKNNTQSVAQGAKLAVLLPGMGSIATTLIAGALAVRQGLGVPVGAYTQLGRLQVAADAPAAPLRELFDLSGLDDMTFGGWDVFSDSAYEAARRAGVLEPALLEQLRVPLSAIRPMPAVFDPELVPGLDAQQCKPGDDRQAWADEVREEIRAFMAAHGCTAGVMLWCGSTESYQPLGAVHQSLAAFETALAAGDPAITPTQIYAWAALHEGLPFVNATPNATVSVPALRELAEREGLPIAGEDLKTGQTMLKTSLASALRVRHLGVGGWYSSNILGNRDGQVLQEEGPFRNKERSKKGVLDELLSGEEQPELWGGLEHQIHINYYPPRGDNKESWDNIDLFGWLGYPMQIKINFLCRDSILAAPLLLDLALWMDYARRRGESGIQEWLSFYFKAPATNGQPAVHGLEEQFAMLNAQLCRFAARSAPPVVPVESVKA